MAANCGTAIVLLIILSASSFMSGDTCYTLEKDVNITREMTYQSSDGNEVLVTCTGSVTLRMCEGMCESQSLPSVVQFPDFKQVSGVGVLYVGGSGYMTRTYRETFAYGKTFRKSPGSFAQCLIIVAS